MDDSCVKGIEVFDQIISQNIILLCGVHEHADFSAREPEDVAINCSVFKEKPRFSLIKNNDRFKSTLNS